MLLLLTTLLALPALAQDDDELDWGDIDLDGDGPKLVEYNGSTAQAQSGFKPDAHAAISLPSGNLKVRCSDGDAIRGNLSFRMHGDDKPALQRFGDSLKLQVWGQGANGGAKVSIGSQPSSVKDATIDLVVTVPVGATVVAEAPRGFVEVTGCEGFVTVSAGKGGAYAKGALTGFKVAAADGNARVELTENTLTKSSSLNAAKGTATLVMPLEVSANLDARGETIRVSHEVAGTVSDTSARGKVGSGGPSLYIRASGPVEITSR